METKNGCNRIHYKENNPTLGDKYVNYG
jgi:hypothetical protein